MKYGMKCPVCSTEVEMFDICDSRRNGAKPAIKKQSK